MPEVSRFYGIVIRIHFRDHLPPHFHAVYGEFEVTIGIVELEIVEGRIPPRALSMTIEWASQHQAELLIDWNLASARLPLRTIEPLR